MTVTLPIAGYAHAALRALTPTQVAFLEDLPKAELHAHLNGSIPLPLLQDLAREHAATASAEDSTVVREGIARLQAGVQLVELNDFFGLFPAIYALTATPKALHRATRAVLEYFLDGAPPQAAYLELRTTPKATPHMDMRAYLETVLDELERYPAAQAALIVSLDRRMDGAIAQEVVALAAQLKAEGRHVVGVDLCGDPTAGDMDVFRTYFAAAKQAGLGVTLHIAETVHNTPADTQQLLSAEPDRLGHATFLNDEAKALVLQKKTCIEICLSSNLLCVRPLNYLHAGVAPCKTVHMLEDHHIRFYLHHDHPIAICTDDILPFRNSLIGEYALLLAPKPLGLGLTEDEVRCIAAMSMQSRFGAA